jgi:hypothetical protein
MSLRRHPAEDCDQADQPSEGCPTHRLIMRLSAAASTAANGRKPTGRFMCLRPTLVPVVGDVTQPLTHYFGGALGRLQASMRVS